MEAQVEVAGEALVEEAEGHRALEREQVQVGKVGDPHRGAVWARFHPASRAQRKPRQGALGGGLLLAGGAAQPGAGVRVPAAAHHPAIAHVGALGVHRVRLGVLGREPIGDPLLDVAGEVLDAVRRPGVRVGSHGGELRNPSRRRARRRRRRRGWRGTGCRRSPRGSASRAPCAGSPGRRRRAPTRPRSAAGRRPSCRSGARRSSSPGPRVVGLVEALAPFRIGGRSAGAGGDAGVVAAHGDLAAVNPVRQEIDLVRRLLGGEPLGPAVRLAGSIWQSLRAAANSRPSPMVKLPARTSTCSGPGVRRATTPAPAAPSPASGAGGGPWWRGGAASRSAAQQTTHTITARARGRGAHGVPER